MRHTSNCMNHRTVQHENYGAGTASYSNDIAILHLATSISLGGNIQAAVLPANNNNDYAGTTCVISGWGRTGKLLKKRLHLNPMCSPIFFTSFKVVYAVCLS